MLRNITYLLCAVCRPVSNKILVEIITGIPSCYGWNAGKKTAPIAILPIL
jgi:hypothetical protein